ncbi:hypothetical protein C8R44DRAFT_847013 [Mycena epipterygia]|nr:hypothetical protein C8R44DRAFT_847013 [Mycena epipterygia]
MGTASGGSLQTATKKRHGHVYSDVGEPGDGCSSGRIGKSPLVGHGHMADLARVSGGCDKVWDTGGRGRRGPPMTRLPAERLVPVHTYRNTDVAKAYQDPRHILRHSAETEGRESAAEVWSSAGDSTPTVAEGRGDIPHEAGRNKSESKKVEGLAEDGEIAQVEGRAIPGWTRAVSGVGEPGDRFSRRRVRTPCDGPIEDERAQQEVDERSDLCWLCPWSKTTFIGGFEGFEARSLPFEHAVHLMTQAQAKVILGVHQKSRGKERLFHSLRTSSSTKFKGRRFFNQLGKHFRRPSLKWHSSPYMSHTFTPPCEPSQRARSRQRESDEMLYCCDNDTWALWKDMASGTGATVLAGVSLPRTLSSRQSHRGSEYEGKLGCGTYIENFYSRKLSDAHPLSSARHNPPPEDLFGSSISV